MADLEHHRMHGGSACQVDHETARRILHTMKGFQHHHRMHGG